jgi:hypothetical protein
MAAPKFVWIIRSWCSIDTYWEHVREHKEFDIAYAKPELLLEEIDRIILKEQSDWEDICAGSGTDKDIREFKIDKPSSEQLKNRGFIKFLTVSSTDKATEEFMQSWYVELLKVVDSN